MAQDAIRPRYGAAQVIGAVDRARGDGRYFLVKALLELPTVERQAALEQVVDKELRPDEQMFILHELTRLRPDTYLERFITSGLRSRSINVQQMTIANLRSLTGEGLEPELAVHVEAWLRHRLANPRRGNTWAPWEVPSAALALLPTYGVDRIVTLLDSFETRLQPEERRSWRSVRQTSNDAQAFSQALESWVEPSPSEPPDPDPRDPTADVVVDRVMKRLGYRPANPDSKVYDPSAGLTIATIVIDASASEPG